MHIPSSACSRTKPPTPASEPPETISRNTGATEDYNGNGSNYRAHCWFSQKMKETIQCGWSHYSTLMNVRLFKNYVDDRKAGFANSYNNNAFWADHGKNNISLEASLMADGRLYTSFRQKNYAADTTAGIYPQKKSVYWSKRKQNWNILDTYSFLFPHTRRWHGIVQFIYEGIFGIAKECFFILLGWLVEKQDKANAIFMGRYVLWCSLIECRKVVRYTIFVDRMLKEFSSKNIIFRFKKKKIEKAN